jgi:hypothetical protein
LSRFIPSTLFAVVRNQSPIAICSLPQ